MNKIRKTYIPSISIAFTCSVIASAIINILSGNNNNGYFSFILQLFVYLVTSVIIDFLICKTPIANSYSSYLIAEAIILYSSFMAVSYFFHWFSFQFENILTSTLIFVLSYIVIQYHFYKLSQQEAEKINQLIEKQKQLLK